ncbi:cyclohexanone monooxygenase [Hyaloraphidium curvatum]|nr:cyclohexanone monooxygenase [Hyaloraphidium curvatum]
MSSKSLSPPPFLYPKAITDSTVLNPDVDPDPLTVTAAETADFALSPAPKYRLPVGKLRRIRVVHIGAGVSGLTFSVLARWRLKNVDLQVYEKNGELGGTWWENRYPGCRCDVPSHYYSFRFLSHDWTSGYAKSPDIWDYLKKVGNVLDFDRICSYNSEVVSATWDESGAVWRLEIKDTTTGEIRQDFCHALINGNGPLNRPKMPDIPGLSSFKGDVLHTARWPKDYPMKGKRAAVIGCGSSGLQLIGGLQPDVAKMSFFMRTPTYITDYSANLVLSEEERAQFRDPAFFRNYLKEFWIGGEKRSNLFKPDSKLQQRFRANALKKFEQVKDPVLRAKLIPNYPVGCRRLTPSDVFFDVIEAPNVEVVVGDVIEKIVPEGIVAEGKLHEVDVICCATGFDTTYTPWIRITGRDGRTLKEMWDDGAMGYRSVSVNNLPNYFMTMGPQAPVASNSIHIFVEQQINYALAVIMELQQGVLIAEPKKEAQDAYNKFCQEGLKGYVYHASCGGWYKGKGGFINAHFPGPGKAYMDSIAAPIWDEWNLVREPQARM